MRRCREMAIVWLCCALSCPVLAGDARKLPATGWRPPTPVEQAWADAHMIRAEQVRLNRLALTRINDERADKSLAALSPEVVGMVADGEEAVGRTARESAAPGARSAMSAEVAVKTAPADLPRQVDNSTLKYFPPVGNQGGLGSCASFSTTYYTLTFAVARANDWTANVSSRWMSPRFTYNLGNLGANGSSSQFGVLMIANSHGCATWSDFPYDGSDYQSLPTNATVWRTATRYRTSVSGLVMNLDTDSGLRQLKAMLANGYLLSIATGAPPSYDDWCATVVQNDPSTTNDNALVGQQIGYSLRGSGGHAMTIVGYNDDIWVDLNDNKVVDTGEKGALKIANQWGTDFHNGGFIWLLYDAIRATSAVSGWTPPAPRVAAFFGNFAIWVSVRAGNYTPTLLAECAMTLQDRGQIAVSGGYGATNASAPNATNSVSCLSMSGALTFSGTMVFDLTDFADAGPTSRWFVGFTDSTSDSATGTVTSVKLTDAQGNLLTNCSQTIPAGGLPESFNGTTVWACADWQFSDTNAPSAVTDLEAIADPNSVTLYWTAPGDDGSNGVAKAYDLRYSPTPITEGNWSSATSTNWPEWKPLAGGGQESRCMYGVFPPGTTWHLAIRASDEAGNTGRLSNVAGVTVPFTLGISTPSVLPPAFSNHPYSVTLAAAGGVPPYTWSVDEGYVENTQGTGSLITGTDMNWRTNSNNASWTLSFTNEFRFNSFGGSLGSITVYNGGYAMAWTPGPLLYLYVFAPFTNLVTTGPGEGIYTEGTANQYTIRWCAHPIAETNVSGTLNFQVTLYTNGTLRYTYGNMSTNVATVGVVAASLSYMHWSAMSAYSGQPIVPGATTLFTPSRPPVGMTVNAASGTLAWVPSQPGTNAFKIRVTDNADVRVMQTVKSPFSIVVAVDGNDNGIADDWEIRHFGGTNVPNGGASQDWDGDGMDNLAEYLAWTNPTNAASALCMSEMWRQGADFVVVWTAVGGRSYVVQTAPALPGGGFADCSPPFSVPGAGECVTNWVDAGAMTHTQRFYRVRLGP